MTSDIQELISRYLDADLTEFEQEELQRLLRSSSQYVDDFARAAQLHDRLHGEMTVNAMAEDVVSRSEFARPVQRKVFKSFAWIAGTVTAALFILGMGWFGADFSTRVTAGELDRLIAAQASSLDRIYRIAVEESVQGKNDPTPSDERIRPPKPPINGATLYVRHGNQFVLVRTANDGRSFVTGSDGRTSWAVRPDGPVRVSHDLSRFNRDLPGHENDVPLFQMEQGLEQLRHAYDVRVLPAETDDGDTAAEQAERFIVAVKKKGHRGPQRVEITYAEKSGLIREMRFVKMPYGPERLTIRMTLTDERELAADFFSHASHHSTDRAVEEE